MSWVDFSGCPEFVSTLDGNAQKTIVEFRGEIYILKFGDALEPDPARPMQGSYNHAPISEHVGCLAVAALGIPVQDTLLGTFRGREVVACRDFIVPLGPDRTLVQFRSLENTLVSSTSRGRAPKLSDIEYVIAEHPFFHGHRNEALAAYWDMLIADALIGNFDRHSGNWGYIARIEPSTHMVIGFDSIAPVYDCGSSLYPKLAEDEMDRISSSNEALQSRALGFPKAKLVVQGSDTIGYRELLMSPEGAAAREALLRLEPAIDAFDPDRIVASVPRISETRRRFLAATLASRLEYILQPALALAHANATS